MLEPLRTGTASSLVNGLMFLMGGSLISRRCLRIDRAQSPGMSPGLKFDQYTAWALLPGLTLAFTFTMV
ncbi:MAG: hypothetical protein MUP90_07615 [Gammaproteobacteria bacterium]|nr:hypothetical protein [Gammaproteobacteria bacterium]